MKTQFKINKNLFLIKGFYYAIDKSSTICNVSVDEDFLMKTTLRHPDENVYSIRTLQKKERGYEPNGQKIIFTNNPEIKKLPMIVFTQKEKEIEKLAKNYLFEDYAEKYVIDNKDIQVGVLMGFITGYKVNPAKWTDKDMIEFNKFCTLNLNENENNFFDKVNDGNGTASHTKMLNLYLQSKEKQIESFEVEVGYNDITDSMKGKIHGWYHKLNSLGQIEAINVKYF